MEFSGLGFDPGSPIPPGESDSHSPRSGSPGKWVARVPESQDPGVQVHSRTEQRLIMLGRWNCAADGGYAARWHSTRSVDQLVRSRIGIAAR